MSPFDFRNCASLFSSLATGAGASGGSCDTVLVEEQPVANNATTAITTILRFILKFPFQV
jgi:hypothetical protein